MYMVYLPTFVYSLYGRIVGKYTGSSYIFFTTLRILTPPMETPDPPNDTPGALKQVVLTPHDIPWSLRVGEFVI